MIQVDNIGVMRLEEMPLHRNLLSVVSFVLFKLSNKQIRAAEITFSKG